MAQPQIGPIQTFAKSGSTTAPDTAPDSVTIVGDSVFVAYTNGVPSDGTGSGTSEIVQYDLSCDIIRTNDIKVPSTD